MIIRKQVRELTIQYDSKLESLNNKYKEELDILQAGCAHDNSSRWEYRTDTYGEPACDSYGVMYKARECQDCGKVEKKLDDVNDYDSEIEF
jgi:hypothetical protein